MADTKIKMTGPIKSDNAQPGTAGDLACDMTIETIVEANEMRYLLYKRRWYGVLIWVLINLMTSWAVIHFTPIFHARAIFRD